MSEMDYSSGDDPRYRVEEEVDERCYFTQIPNLIFELPISREAKWFYVHLKRTAGDKGRCYKSLRTLSKETQTSKPTLIKAKAELVEYGLIRIEQADRGDRADTITIRNIWRRNIAHFDRVVKEKTATPVNDETGVVKEKTAPGKGGNRKKNPPKKNQKEGIKRTGKKDPMEGYEYLLTKRRKA